MASVRYWYHRYPGRTPVIWKVLTTDAGVSVFEVARSVSLLRPTDPSPVPSSLMARSLQRGTRTSRLRVTRMDHLSHKRPGLGQSQNRAAWEKWSSAENPTSEDGALARAQEYGHGEVSVRTLTVREMRAEIRKAKTLLRPWSSVKDRERVALLCEGLERGIDHIRSLKGGKK